MYFLTVLRDAKHNPHALILYDKTLRSIPMEKHEHEKLFYTYTCTIGCV